MATYHICDLCGKNIEDDDNIFRLIVLPEYVYKKIPNPTTEFANKEICKDCAKVWSDNFNTLDELKDVPDWEAKIYSPKYEDMNSNLYYNDNFYKMEVSKYQ